MAKLVDLDLVLPLVGDRNQATKIGVSYRVRYRPCPGLLGKLQCVLNLKVIVPLALRIFDLKPI
ncbi:MAG: hypothetical protein EAZ11_06885 [Curvibacter sp.]|nr:MAG: hypothetical protein EAZ11_06885 [Curvibacter sp.]